MNSHDYVMALAMNHDPATVIVGNTKIPVLITDVDSRHMAGCAPETKFTCQVVDAPVRATFADRFAPEEKAKLNALYRKSVTAERLANAAVAAAQVANVPSKALTVGRDMYEAYANHGCFTIIQRLMTEDAFAIDRVYFNDPATVVLWKDGTKTIVRCQKGDTYSAETGLALCFAKKALGNKGGFNDVFKKYIPVVREPETVTEEAETKDAMHRDDVIDITDVDVAARQEPETVVEDAKTKED